MRVFRWAQIFLLLACFSTGGCGKKSSTSTYEIGFDPSWYPLQLGGQERRVLAFSMELLAEIAKRETLPIAVIERNWDNLLWGLKKEEYSAALSTKRPFAFYQKVFSFSHLYLKTGPVVVVPTDSQVEGMEGLKGKTVGVVTGSSASILLQSVPGIVLKGYDSIPIVLSEVEMGNVQAAVVQVLVAQDFLRDLYKEKLKIASEPLSEEGLRLLTMYSKEPRLMKDFDRGLAKLKKSGKYEELLKKWGLSPDGEPVANLDHKVEAFLQNFF